MPQNRLRNLATAVQVSIDTAVQHCKVNHLGGVGISSLISLVCVLWVVLMVVLTFVLVFIGMFVFMFMQYIVIGTNAGADGCNSRTRLAWLGEYLWGGGAACHVCGSVALQISGFLL